MQGAAIHGIIDVMDLAETGEEMTQVEGTAIAEAQANATEFACGLALTWRLACAIDDETETNTLQPLFPIVSDTDREVAKAVLMGRRERNHMFQLMAAMMEVTYGISA